MTDTTNQAAALKECPFCGSAKVKAYAYGQFVDGEPDAFCQCEDCATAGPSAADKADAIAAWNRRSASQPAGTERQFCEHCHYDHSVGPLCKTASAIARAALPAQADHSEELLDMVPQAAAQAPTGTSIDRSDLSDNAEWLSLAHTICAEAGIEPGHIGERLAKLRDLLEVHKLQLLTAAAQAPGQQEAAVKESLTAGDAQSIREKALKEAAEICKKRSRELESKTYSERGRDAAEARSCAFAILAHAGSQQAAKEGDHE